MKKNIYRDWTQVSCIAGWFFTIWATRETMVVQPASRVRCLVTPWTVARQASLSLTISQSLPRFMFIVSVILSSHLIFWCPLLLLPLILPSIRDFSNASSMRIRWPKYWRFSFSISPSNEYSGMIFLKIGWFDLLAVQRTFRSLLQHHSSKASTFWHSAFFTYGPALTTVMWPLGRP